MYALKIYENQCTSMPAPKQRDAPTGLKGKGLRVKFWGGSFAYLCEPF